MHTTSENYSKLYNTLHNFKQFYKTLQTTFTKLYTTVQQYTTFTQLDTTLQKKTLEHITQLFQHFTQHTIQNFTQK